MSIPIPACLAAEAIRGDAQAYRRLLTAMRINLLQRSWQTVPCEHTPRCDQGLTEEQIERFHERLLEDLE